MCRISTQDSTVLVPFRVVEDALQGFADAVISRLAGVDERAYAVRAEWEARTHTTTGEFVAIATGLEDGVLSQLQGDHDLAGFWELDADDFPSPNSWQRHEWLLRFRRPIQHRCSRPSGQPPGKIRLR